MELIRLDHVSKIYPMGESETVAIDDLSLIIDEGEFVSIMGPSGSGKSTLLHILGLLDRPTKGGYFYRSESVIEHNDVELAKLRNFEIGFVFQRFNLLRRSTVLDNVKLPLNYSDLPRRQWNELAQKAIAAVGLEHRMYHLSSQLSGGESQRVAIARAIVNSPSVVFADEPTGNLDSQTGQQIMDIITRLHKKGSTIVLITHESSAADYGERIIHLKDGKLIKDQKKRRRTGKKFSK